MRDERRQRVQLTAGDDRRQARAAEQGPSGPSDRGPTNGTERGRCGGNPYTPVVVADRTVRAGALLGVIGGGLRAAGSFAPALIASDRTRAGLYVTVDVCLAAGLLSVYMPRRRGMSAAGPVGFYLALAGLIATRISAAFTRVDLYPISAAAVAIGVMVLALSEWRAGRLAAWIPGAFALSLVVGSLGTFVAGAGSLFVVSGILFGVVFAAMAVTAR